MQEQCLGCYLAESDSLPIYSLTNITMEHVSKDVPCDAFSVVTTDGGQAANLK